MKNKPEFDKYAKEYDTLLSDSMPSGLDEGSYFAEYKIALIAKLMDEKKINSILDYGCGAGRSMPYLAKYFPRAELFGYDPSPISLKLAAKRSASTTYFSKWSDIKNYSFDLIIVANVFHHIIPSERLKTLIQCREVLVSKGSMFIFEHNPYNPATRWIFERCPFDVDAEMLSMQEAKNLVKLAGMRLDNHAYTLFFPRPLAFLRPFERFLKHFALGAQYYVQIRK